MLGLPLLIWGCLVFILIILYESQNWTCRLILCWIERVSIRFIHHWITSVKLCNCSFPEVHSLDRRFARKPLGRPRLGNKFHKADTKPWANHRQMSGAKGGGASIGFQPAIGRPWEPDSLRGKWSQRHSESTW